MCQAPPGATSVSRRARGQRIALRRCEQAVLRGALWRVQCGKKPGVPYFTEDAREWKGPLGPCGRGRRVRQVPARQLAFPAEGISPAWSGPGPGRLGHATLPQVSGGQAWVVTATSRGAQPFGAGGAAVPLFPRQVREGEREHACLRLS